MNYADDLYFEGFDDNQLDGFWSGLKKVGKFVGKKAVPFVPVVGGVAAAGIQALEQRSANKKQIAAEQAAQIQTQQQAATQAAQVQAAQMQQQNQPLGGDNTLLYVGGGLAAMMFMMMMMSKK